MLLQAATIDFSNAFSGTSLTRVQQEPVILGTEQVYTYTLDKVFRKEIQVAYIRMDAGTLLNVEGHFSSLYLSFLKNLSYKESTGIFQLFCNSSIFDIIGLYMIAFGTVFNLENGTNRSVSLSSIRMFSLEKKSISS